VTGLHTERLGHGPRIVLVHGFTQTGRSWGALAEDLAADHEVVLVDGPGHGGSASVVADLVTGAELLGAAGGPGTYVGYSMGGRLALHLALAQPDLVPALVLIGATPGIEDPAVRAQRRAADEALAAGLERDGLDAFLAGWLAQPLFASLPAEAAALDDRRRNTVAGLASSLRSAGTGTQEPLWDRLGELHMPVLLLTGEHDERFGTIGRRMAAEIGDNATWATVPDAGHAAHLEQPGSVLTTLRAWLDAFSRRGPGRG
jgi:2-succinyl-6-hydroxy-2,4-cyclohexadiene-1-carboxylate synthase